MKSMYVRPAATMLPFDRRSACAASMSAVLASVTVMNAGRWPAWSSAMRLRPALRPPEFRPREHRQAQIDHRRVQRVQQLLNRNPCPGDIDRQRPSKRAERSRHGSRGFSAFTRASDDHDTSPMPRWHGLCDCADRFDTRSRRLRRLSAAPCPSPRTGSTATASAPSAPAFASAPALELMSRHQLEQAPEHRAIVRHGLDPCVSIDFRQTQSYRTGRSKPPIAPS